MEREDWKRAAKILVVDDDPVNVKLLEAILKVEGFATLSADSGEKGREIAYAEMPDLILLDIMMGGENGFDTCARLKQDPRTSAIPIILISALDDVDSKVAGFDVDAEDYITKPFRMEEVIARVRRHLKLKSGYQAVIDRQADKLKQIHDAQQAILVQPESIPEARFGVYYLPVMEAGGDFYEVLKIGPSTFGYFVADVCGHDLGASYATSALKVLMSEEIASSGVPGDVMRRMNTALGSVLTEGKYITACYARLDRSRSELTVVNAGHPPPIYVGRDGAARRMEGRGDILGVFEKVSFGAERISTSPGDRFFLYTDGFIEGFISRKMSRDEGLTALLEACSKTLGLPVGDAVKEVRMALYPDSGDVEDDLLLLGVDL